jgi:hypothetical protein
VRLLILQNQARDIAFSGGCLGPQIALVNLDEADTEVNIAIRVDDDDGRMEVEDLALPFRRFNLQNSEVKVL